MGTAMVQLNTRIDPMLKAGGDAVLTRNGLGPSDAIRALWAYLVEHQALPGFMLADKRELPRREEPCRAGVWASFFLVGAKRFGFASAGSSADNWDAVRDDMYDAMIADMEANCR